MQHTIKALVQHIANELDAPGIAPGRESHGEAFADMFRQMSYVYDIESTAVARLWNAGFRLVGSGHFAAVLSHQDTPGVVYKFTTNMDDMYHEFALFCARSKDKHLPVVHAIYEGAYLRVYALDELEGIGRHRHLAEFSAYELKDRVVYYPDWRSGKEAVRNDSVGSPLYNRTLMRAMRKLAKWKHRARISGAWDMHSGNVMYNPRTKAVVITDPLC